MQHLVYLHEIIAIDNPHALPPLSVATGLSSHLEHLGHSLGLGVHFELRLLFFK